MNTSIMICSAIALAFLLVALFSSSLLPIGSVSSSSTSSPLPFRVCPGSKAATAAMMGEKRGLCGGSTGVMNTRGMCLEKISEDPFVNMAGHPNGSTRDVFLSSQDGKIWLASVPVHGAGDALHYINGGSAGRPFLDLTDRLRYNDDDDPVIGLRGVAFHPEFSTNGRFFVAYTCDCDNISTACTGDVECWVPDPGNRPRRCRYQLVVAEYRAQGGGLTYSKEPSEVRRFFAMGLSRPKKSYSYQHHGGQLLFRPAGDGGNGRYLYLVVGQEFVWFQNQRSVPSKIIRFDIDRATPKAEIYAGGVSNPSGCSFDSGRPSNLYCAEVDQRRYEQVYLISEIAPVERKYRSASSAVVSHGRPAAGRTRMPSIVGGLLYRGSADPSLKGRYLYMYGSAAWVAAKSSTGGYTSARISNIRCSGSTPLACRGINGRVVSFGQDNDKDAYVLATCGVYRVVHSDLCTLDPPPTTTPTYWSLYWWVAVALSFAFYRIYSVIILGDNGGGATTCCSGCCSNWFTTNHNYHTAQSSR